MFFCEEIITFSIYTLHSITKKMDILLMETMWTCFFIVKKIK